MKIFMEISNEDLHGDCHNQIFDHFIILFTEKDKKNDDDDKK